MLSEILIESENPFHILFTHGHKTETIYQAQLSPAKAKPKFEYRIM